MIILASKSPRRAELLARIEEDFQIIVSNFDESSVKERIPEKLVRELAYQKALVVAKSHPEDIVIGCDTIVVSPDNEIFGIPKDEEEARHMLSVLSGRTHRVISGVCVIKSGKKSIFHKVTKVSFSDLSQEDIDWYIGTKEPFDKAGAYGIQGMASAFVSKINGDFYSVVGLPLNALRQILKKYK